MKKDLKKFEQFIRKISKEPGVDFTNKLMDKLREEHPCFKKNSNNNFSWQIIKLINIVENTGEDFDLLNYLKETYENC